MNYKYTVIAKTISGKYLHTHHYERKADAMQEVSHLLNNCYQIEVMDYFVWVTERMKQHTA